MSEMSNYSYFVPRYVHDIIAGEFVNVGVVPFCPDARYAGAYCRSTYKRLGNMFSDLNGENFKALMRYGEARFAEIGERVAT